MKVRIAERAQADLEEIGDWIAAENPVRAASFVAELVDRALSLGRHPRRFPAVPRAGGLRKLAWRGYLIFYVTLPDRVEIARIVHGSRDWAALFVEE